MNPPAVTGYGYEAGWLIVGSAAVVVGLSLAISLVHARNIRTLRRRAGGGGSPSVLRAWHVATIAVVLAGYAAMVAVGALDNLGFPGLLARNVRFVVYATLNGLAIASLVIITRVVLQRARGLAARGTKKPPAEGGGPGMCGG